MDSLGNLGGKYPLPSRASDNRKALELDFTTGALLFIDILYEKGEISKQVYDAVQKKYRQKK